MQVKKSLDEDEAKTVGGGRGCSLTWLAGLVGEDEGRGQVEPPVQIPEKTATPGLGSGSCPFHREPLGPETCGLRGLSGALRELLESSVAGLHSAQS